MIETGQKTDNETHALRRMKTICTIKEDGNYVVADYIFVPEDYSFNVCCFTCRIWIDVMTRKVWKTYCHG